MYMYIHVYRCSGRTVFLNKTPLPSVVVSISTQTPWCSILLDPSHALHRLKDKAVAYVRHTVKRLSQRKMENSNSEG